MKLYVDSNLLYCNGLMFCRVEAGNGRTNIPLGVSEIEVRTATEHGTIPMAYADGHGWLGGLTGCDIILGGVRGRTCIIPNPALVDALLVKLEVAEGLGKYVLLEVK